MLKLTDKIRVLPNPWLYLSADGEPQCAVLKEVGDGIGWVGATRDPKTGKFSFATSPVNVIASKYIRARIGHGELILADKEHASDLGITFIDPDKLLTEFKAKSVAEYDSQHGDGVWQANENERNPAVESAPEDSTAKAKIAARKTSASE